MEKKIIKVLLIEDNPADARLVSEMLKDATGVKFHLEKADRLSSATEALSGKDFDIVLLDLSLPDSMGFDSFTRIHNGFPHLPVIVFTGLPDEEMAIKAVMEGAQDYLVKGEVDSALLVRAIRYAIERKKLEERLIKSEKMESIGHMAEGIAHDFGNILMVIKGNASLFKEKLHDLKERRSFSGNIDKIIESSDRALNIIKGLHALGRKQAMSPKIVDVNSVIQKFEGFILILIGKKNIALSLNLSDVNLNVMGDSTQIEQVLMNLAINARDAMPEGGRLMIETGFLESPDGVIESLGLCEPGKYAVVTVSDTGHGIDGKVIGRIFEPFFTTKGEANGTGLGLSMVYAIIRQHNGYINCSSKPGEGTTFKIYFPIVTSEA